MNNLVQLPRRCGNWKVIDEIGSGSYGHVYLAQNEDTSEVCAVKVIKIPDDQNEVNSMLKSLGDKRSVRDYYLDLVSSFDNEIKTLERFNDADNIVSIKDSYIQESRDGIGWTIFIFMEYLNDFANNGFFDDRMEADVIKLGIDVCNALELCEQNSIIHRDLKPDNILVDNDGNYKLCDFGVAKQLDSLNKTNTVRGTFEYMSPEIYHGQKSGHRADIYSLGMIMYRMMNEGFAPFIDTSKQLLLYSDREQSLAKRMSGESLPKPINASDALAEVILKACAYMPEDRYESASKLRVDLTKIRDGSYKIKNRKKAYSKHLEGGIRKRILAISTCVIAVVGIAGFVLPSATNCLWYNPAKIIQSESGENIHQFTSDMKVYGEIKIPEIGCGLYGSVGADGWGRYSYYMSNEFVFGDNEELIAHECEGEIVRDSIETPELMKRLGVRNSLWLSKNVTPSITGTDYMQDDKAYCAYVTFKNEMTYEALYELFYSEGPELGFDSSWLWCGIKVAANDNEDCRDRVGFYANSDEYTYTELLEPEAAKSHFVAQLDGLAKKTKFLKLWNESPSEYRQYLEYITDRDELMVYGIIYISNNDNIRKVENLDYVHSVVVEEV